LGRSPLLVEFWVEVRLDQRFAWVYEPSTSTWRDNRM